MKDNLIKITNSAYKLIEFFPEEEAIKSKAKEKVLNIMENLMPVFENDDWLSIGEYFSSDSIIKKDKAVEDIETLLAYFEIGKSQGWLSGINYLIISSQYKNIKKQIKPLAALVKTIVEKKETNKIIPKPIKIKEQLPEPKLSLKKNTPRQEKIIEFLKTNQQAQVMDLLAVLPNVTKRTIRRDLDDLLRAHEIQRMGEFNRVVYKIKG